MMSEEDTHTHTHTYTHTEGVGLNDPCIVIVVLRQQGRKFRLRLIYCSDTLVQNKRSLHLYIHRLCAQFRGLRYMLGCTPSPCGSSFSSSILYSSSPAWLSPPEKYFMRRRQQRGELGVPLRCALSVGLPPMGEMGT